MTIFAYVANTNNVLLNGLQSELDSVYLNAATVTVTIVDAKKIPVTGATFPLSMNYVSGSNGNYVATLTHTLAILNGRPYTAIIDANGNISGTEHIGHWEFPFTAQTRTS